MSDRKVGIALFGLGRAGNIHLQNLRTNNRCKVLYIVESEVDKAIEIATKYSLTETRIIAPESWNKVFTDKCVQAVVVCTPTFTHEEIIMNALRNGKAVFSEKPLAQNLGGVIDCYKVAQDTKLQLMCSFNRRFDPSFRQVRDNVKAGACGKIHVVKTCARDHPLPPMEYLKISGGLFHDCAVHDIDLVCWILGEFPCSVFAQATSHHAEIKEMGDVDTTIITLKFPSGALASIDLSRNASYGYDQRLEVFGSDGMLIAENHRPTSVVKLDKDGAHSDCIKYSFPQRYAESYVAAMEHFLDVLTSERDSTCIEITGQETVNICKIADACEESVKHGKLIQLNL